MYRFIFLLSLAGLLLAAPTFSAQEEKQKEVQFSARGPLKQRVPNGVARSVEDLDKLKVSLDTVKEALKVKDINFDKQMLVMVEGRQGGVGDTISIQKIEIDAAKKTMTVRWKFNRFQGIRIQIVVMVPGQVALIDRFGGDVHFVAEK
jgi:hypothetical protein